MKVFITGGSGFIGSHVVTKLFARKHKLLLLSRRPPRNYRRKFRGVAFIKGDLENIRVWAKKIKRFKPSAVIHFAWEGLESYDFSAKTSSRNLINSLSLISLAASLKCKKFLSIGSSWEYGKTWGKLKESDSLGSSGHVPNFTIAKKTIQLLGEQIAHESGMQFFWPRLFFAYGPGQKSRALIPSLVRSFQSGVAPDIKNKTGGNDFVYVEDVADAIVKILERCKKPSAIYNIGSGRLTSVARVASLVAKNFNHPPLLKEPKKPRGFYANISKIKRGFDWSPKTTIAEGVRKTIEYYRKNG